MVATVLKAGEFAIIGYNGGSTDGTGRAPTTDKIHFVLLAPIGAGTTIYFTDRTWTPTAGNTNLNAGTFSNSGADGTYTYTAGADLPAGTVITITAAQLIAAGVDFEHVSGEAIYAYQGLSANAPTAFLFALEGGDGNTVFNASLVNTGLVSGTNAVSIPYDSGSYSGPTTHAGAFLFNGTPLINSVADFTNWGGDDQDGQNAVEAQVQTGPWLIAPRIDIWGTAAGGGGAIIRTSGDQTVSGGTDDYNHAELYNGLLSGGVSVFWNLRDMAFDTVEGKFFVVDSDLGGGHNRILQGNIADLVGNPGVLPTLTVLYSDPSTAVDATNRLDNLEVDVANNIIYFTHASDLFKINFNTANQTPTVLFHANVTNITSPSGAGNPAGSTSNFFNDLAINFTTGAIYLSSTRVGASAGGDSVIKNFIYELTGLTTSSGTDAFQFNAGNTGTARLLPFALNDDAYNPNAGTLANQVSTAADPYFLAKEFGSLDGLAIDPASNILYFSTGAILFDHDGSSGTAPIYQTGIVGRYALGANAANGQGVITVVHSQPGGPNTGLYGDLEIDVAAGKWYVTDYNGTGANNEDSHLYSGDLTGGARTQFSQQIGNIEGLSTVGFAINHAPTLTGTAVGGTVTEAPNAPSSGNTSTVSLFSGVTLDDIDTSTANELTGAVIRIATNFQSGATHQDFLRISGNTSGTLGSGIAYAYNAATGALILSGQNTVANYKAAIELVTFGTSGDDPTAFGNAQNRVIAVAVTDGLSVSDEITANITVVGINDAPVNTLGAQAAGTEDTLVTAVTGLLIADVDTDPAATAQKIGVNLFVDIGNLTILATVAGGLVAGDIVGNGTASVTLQGTLNAINATLAAAGGVTLTTVANFNGGSTLTIATGDRGFNGTDPGATGDGTFELDIDSRVITITAVNDAPTIADTSNVVVTSILEDTPTVTFTETVATLFGARFADTLDQQQTGGNPTGSVANSFAGIAVTANGSGANGQWEYYNGAAWTPIGTASLTLAVLVAASAPIRFNPTLNFNGPAPTLTVALVDSSGGALTNGAIANATGGGTTRYIGTTLTLTESVTAVNDAPVNTVPTARTFVEDSVGANGATPVNAIPGLSISDVDAGTGTVQVTLSVGQGVLLLRTDVASGVVAGDVSGNGTASIVVTATIAKINATLAAVSSSANGLVYTPAANFNGTDTLQIVTNDLGLNGLDPSLTGGANNEIDVDTVTINVTTINDAPTVVNGTTEATATISEDQPSAVGQTVTTLFGGHFSDALDAQTGTPNGTAASTLAGVAVTVNGSGATGQWQYFNGTIWVDIGVSSVTSAQAITAGTTIRFNPAANYNGAAPALTAVLIESGGAAFINGDDLNVTTTGGATRYATGGVTLSGTVTAVNDAPIATIVPPMAALGSEIRVNTATASHQLNQKTTALSNGGFVVTWQDSSFGVGGATGDTSGSAVKAQVFVAGGTAVGGEILVNTATANSQDTPQITALSNGGFVVTWRDNSLGVGGATGDTSSTAVKAQVFAAGGTAVGSEIRVNTATANDQFAPQITALSNGGFVVTWNDLSAGVGGATGDTSSSAIKAQVFAAGGTAVGGEIRVNTATAGTQDMQQITALSNGGFVVTWRDISLGVGGATGDTSSTAVKAQVFAAGGTAVGGEILVNTATANSQDTPQITALSNGGFVVTWRDGSLGVGGATGDNSGFAVKAQVFAAGGTPVGGEIRVNTATANDQFAPQITALSNGGFVVTWRDFSLGAGGATGDNSGYAVKAQVFAAGGTAVGGEIRVNTATASDQDTPQITALSNGGFVVTWRDFSQGVGGATGDNSGYAIKAQVFAAGGTAVGGEILVNTATASDQDTPQITALSNGGFVVTWQDQSRGVGGATGDNSGYAVKAQVFGASTTYAATEQVALSVKGTLAVADVDGTSGTVTLSTTYGILDVTAGTSGAIVTSGNGTGSVTITGTLVQINALLNIDATSVVTFTANTDTPPASATLTLGVNDGGETGAGGAQTGTATATIVIAAIDDLPVAVADPVTTAENVVLTGSLTFNDTDVDGGPKTIVSVNGVGASVGAPITLASGAKLTVQADGSYSYDPNGKFDYLVSSAKAATNPAYAATATDSFTYALNGGSSATVTVTISGVDGASDQLRGTVASETINGTAGADYVDFSQGGTDIVNAGDGDDLIFAGAEFDPLDQINGGIGTDQVGLFGSYVGSLGNVIGTESLVVLSGTSVRYGGDGTPRYSYDLTTTEATVAPGVAYTVQANELVAGENLRFDGSAETDGGSFRIYAGKGIDTFIGGSGGDGFFFGEGGRFTAADQVNGGGGNDQLGLRGNYAATITFSATTLVNVETIVLLSAFDAGVAVEAPAYSYVLVLNNATVASGQTLTINAAQLRGVESANVNGSSEADGNFIFIGGQGADVFVGGASADTLSGGLGVDTLTGGNGNDIFMYRTAADSGPGVATRDTITDFTVGDRIDLQLIDAVPGAGDDAFSFAAAFTNTPGQLRVTLVGPGNYLVEGDIDGNGVADFGINVTSDHVLTATDFIL